MKYKVLYEYLVNKKESRYISSYNSSKKVTKLETYESDRLVWWDIIDTHTHYNIERERRYWSYSEYYVSIVISFYWSRHSSIDITESMYSEKWYYFLEDLIDSTIVEYKKEKTKRRYAMIHNYIDSIKESFNQAIELTDELTEEDRDQFKAEIAWMLSEAVSVLLNPKTVKNFLSNLWQSKIWK